jgi:hypothetical protein
MGKLLPAKEHIEMGIALYDPERNVCYDFDAGSGECPLRCWN